MTDSHYISSWTSSAHVRVEKHQFSSTYLRLNNNIKYFPRCDISEVLRFLSCVIW